ncbi:hypothetical protein Areg01_21890 [Actinoplanes regularis]|nr:hypothetical protein Areg01_21890 [Actinoplanes regularis]
MLVPPRPDSGGAAPAPGDILGAVPTAEITGAAPGAPLRDLVQPLPTVGTGEPASAALLRTPIAATWLAVLTDGRITGLITRTALETAGGEAVGGEPAPAVFRPGGVRRGR